ncbi:snRNA-activating protein complex subunit 3 [Anabrus simplex]|uniref:snRNA-activating protein complex subunit 3 n=1 Tax=Anabrus simplex TaxID=316456 RepID=UPI0034DD95C6
MTLQQPPLKGRRDLKPWEDVILVVKVYEPIRIYSRGSRICNPPPVFLYDLAVLGSQTLDQLRDKINCVSDWSVTEGVTDNPAKQIKAKDIYKSGFFYIEGVFYNDFRHAKNHDYSEVIRKFAEEKGQGPFRTAVMEHTRFVDLTLRVGYPYLYQHQGECKHFIMFVDIRLLNESDPLVSRNYPFHLRIVRKMSHLCMVCKLHTARWVTHDNERTWTDYCYFCDNCFRSFNYTFRKKIGKFRAYRYYDRAIVL